MPDSPQRDFLFSENGFDRSEWWQEYKPPIKLFPSAEATIGDHWVAPPGLDQFGLGPGGNPIVNPGIWAPAYTQELYGPQMYRLFELGSKRGLKKQFVLRSHTLCRATLLAPGMDIDIWVFGNPLSDEGLAGLWLSLESHLHSLSFKAYEVTANWGWYGGFLAFAVHQHGGEGGWHRCDW